MKKRVLSLFMAFTLCFSMQPTVAFAAETGVVTEQEVPSSENTTEVYTADSISDGDVSGGDAGVQDAEKDETVRAAQELINALPDEVTADNAEMIGGQLAAIDEALAALTDEQRGELDMERYDAICAALIAFVAAQDGEHTAHCQCGDPNCTSTQHTKPDEWTALSYDQSTGQLKIDGVDWNPTSADCYILPAGSYYLETDLKTGATIQNSGNVNLCLNGHSITATGNFDVLTLVGNDQAVGSARVWDFYLCDCVGGGEITHDEGAIGRGVNANNLSCFTMYGGTITGNNAGNNLGGGVYAAHFFCMVDGTISNNQAGSGGGVYGSSTVKITGGSIEGNAATSGNGGGVWVSTSDVTFTLSDVSITGNTAKNMGGGVYIGKSTYVNMCNVSITGNTADSMGGGMMLQTSGNISMWGKVVINENTAASKANNLYLEDSGKIKVKAALTGSKIGVSLVIDENDYVVVAKGDSYTLKSEDKAVFALDDVDAGYVPIDVDNSVAFRKGDPHEHTICVNADCTEAGHDNVVWKGISDLSEIKEDGNYYLKQSVTRTSTWTCYYNINLCLNGNSIIVSAASDAIKVVYDHTFTLCDCNGNGKITHKSGQTGRGVYVVKGNFTMYSGSITGNKTTTGGGVNIDSSGSFIMYGGSITNNEASGNGGGVNVGAYRNFTMYGGSITNNIASGKGGGVNVDAKGSFAMYGGSINDLNIARVNGEGDGVYVGGTMTVGGGAQITGNGGSNVYLPSGKTIIIGTKGLSSSANIGVTMGKVLNQGEYVSIAKGASDDYTLTADDLAAFSSDTGYTNYELDNAVIFSNGELHMHGECGTADCTHTTHENVLWTAIGTEAELRAITGGTDTQYYYLTNNMMLGSKAPL